MLSFFLSPYIRRARTLFAFCLVLKFQIFWMCRAKVEIQHLHVYSLGRMRCLAALARWEELNNLCKDFWTPAEPSARLEMAPMVVF